MSYNKSGRWATLVAHVDGGLTVADGTTVGTIVMPFDCYIERVTMSVQEGGATSGANEVMLVDPEGNDMWAANTLESTYSANGTAVSITRSSLNTYGDNLFDEGDAITLEIHDGSGGSGAGGSPANLTVTVHVVGA